MWFRAIAGMVRLHELRRSERVLVRLNRIGVMDQWSNG